MKPMRKMALGAIAVMLCAGFGTETAFANTYYCDNDRDPGQYPNCSTSFSGTWMYRSGQSGDWNGDDRLGYSGDGYYDWKFYNVAGNEARLYAWLANASFTNQSTEYSVDTDVIGYMNQNTAPSGWNSPGTHPIFGSPFFQVDNFDWSGNKSTRTGADIIRIETYHRAAAGPDVSRYPVKADDSDLAQIQHKMLNAVDYYSDLQGSFQMKFSNIGPKNDVMFSLSEEDPGSYVKVTREDGTSSIQKSDGTSIINLTPETQVYSKKSVSSSSPPVSARHYRNEKGQDVYVHRQDPAWARTANEVTLPQNYAFWLTSSQSEVVGHDTLLNREVTIIEGKHDPYLKKKLGADTFTMWVDRKTGVLLKLEGKDSKGNIAYFIDVKEIQFDQGVDSNKFTITEPTGWKNVSGDQ